MRGIDDKDDNGGVAARPFRIGAIQREREAPEGGRVFTFGVGVTAGCVEQLSSTHQLRLGTAQGQARRVQTDLRIFDAH
eukprot:116705-Chlamydomonas_euryale.AAC.1